MRHSSGNVKPGIRVVCRGRRLASRHSGEDGLLGDSGRCPASAATVPLLAAPMAPRSLGSLLVAAGSRLDGLTAADGGALALRAVPIPPVTWGTDHRPLPAQCAVENPMALFDGNRTSGTLALDKCSERANTLGQLSCRAVRTTETVGLQPWVSVFIWCAGPGFYLPRLPECERLPLTVSEPGVFPHRASDLGNGPRFARPASRRASPATGGALYRRLPLAPSGTHTCPS